MKAAIQFESSDHLRSHRLSAVSRDRPVLHGIDPDQLRVVYQPILDLSDGDVFGYEVLARSREFSSPPELFRAAVRQGCVGGLGRLLRELAVQRCPHHTLFLNVHPGEFNEGWLVRPDDPIFHHEPDVYLEITESVPINHFHLASSVLNEIRGRNIHVAVDDLGSGYSNLKYIADLSPDIVKLDRALVANLADDKRLRTLARSLVRLCEDLGAKVVAEGIEQLDELHAAREVGAQFGQGYLIARPAEQLARVSGHQFGL